MSFRSIFDAIAKSSGRKYRRPRRRLGIRYPTVYAIQYKREIADYIKALKREVDEWVTNALSFELKRLMLERGDARVTYRQDSVDDIETILEELDVRLSTVLTVAAIRELVLQIARRIREYNERQFTRAIMLFRKAPPTIREQVLVDIMEAHVHENVRLIKSIPEKYLADVERVVMASIRSGQSPDEIAAAIEAVYPTSRAKMIAIDQCGSYNGALAEELAAQNGLETYIWRDNRDERVRGNPAGLYPHAKPSHWARNGFVFSWKSPPEGGHPGMAYLCRCWAQIQEAEAKGDRKNMVQPGERYDEDGV